MQSKGYLGELIVEEPDISLFIPGPSMLVTSSKEAMKRSRLHFDYEPDLEMEFFDHISFDGFEIDILGDRPAIVSRRSP